MTLKLGMVGGGEGAFIGGVHRIASRLDDRYKLVAGALSSEPERSRRSAAALGIEPDRAYSDFETMAREEKQRPDGIDVVAIVTPNHMHFPVAKAFIEQGIDVICDKPVTTSLEEAVALQQLVREHDAYFALTHNYTAYPMVRQAREMVQSGQIGQLRLVQVEYVQDWLSENSDAKQAQWRTDPKRSGPVGCLGDIGTHAYNLALFISGDRVNELSAELSTFVKDRPLDDNAHIMMRFASGARGMLWSSQVAPGNENGLRIRLYGDKGGLEWQQESPNELWFTPLGGATSRFTRGSGTAMDVANRASRIPAGHPEGYLEGFANLYSNIADALLARRNGTPAMDADLVPGIADGIIGMQFIEAALMSSRHNGRWQSLPA